MAKADIEISIQDGGDSFGVPTFRPNDVVHGNFTVFPDSNVKCKKLLVRLVWQTEGRGTRFREVVEEQDVFQGELQGGMPRSFDFQFSLPNDPWSHEGHYVSIVWGIEVQIDVPWSKDPKQVENFVLSPEREVDSNW
jgi:hypothetical protein